MANMLRSLVLLAATCLVAGHGTGCEHALDQSCSGWKQAGLQSCLACVRDHWDKLSPTCGSEDKADHKCQQANPPAPGPAPALPPFAPHPSSTRPNIVLVLTDDQDSMLGSMVAMPFTRALTAVGANLTNFFAHTPVCCPSRSELLTGRYFHNLRNAVNRSAAPVTTEEVSPDNCMHVNASMSRFEHATIGAQLQKAGYRTGMFGKYLNSGGMRHICDKPVGTGELAVPAGWHEFLGACPDTCYTDCNYNHNGKSAWFRDPRYPNGSNYGTSVIGNLTLQFVEAALSAKQPFFAMVASHAPHGPATPAPWYRELYSAATAPRTLSYNVSSPSKHWVVATQPAITQEYQAAQIDQFYKNRLRSLLSVDDIVRALYGAVEAAGQLDNTFFVFTSDHGLHMGQFRLGPCKRQPYETDIRIPTAIAGPGVRAGPNPLMASIPDLAPTFLELAGATVPDGMDGKSLAAQLADPGGAAWRDSVLIEYYATTTGADSKHLASHLKDSSNNTFVGLRVINSTLDLAYFEFSDVGTDWAFERPNFCELYNLTADPHQLTNLCVAGASEQLKRALHEQLARQYRCAGASCL